MNILGRNTLVLASKSPRRKELLENLNIPYTIKVQEVEEVYSDKLTPIEVVKYLSVLKASVFTPREKEIVLTADTIVVYKDKIIGKPKDAEDAKSYLKLLSGNSHQVITGFSLKSKDNIYTEAVTSEVSMMKITEEEIGFYVDTYTPLDKAGSYGIQEWIGYAKIDGIKGSYSNIMGLPTHAVYLALKQFVDKMEVSCL